MVHDCRIWLPFWIFGIQNLDSENVQISKVSSFQIPNVEDNLKKIIIYYDY